MGWSIGFDTNWRRDVGYGVPAYCDHPDCHEEIDRGLAHVCCDQQPYGGTRGCGLYFCFQHQDLSGRCERCAGKQRPFPAKPDHPRWMRHKLTHDSWQQWRTQNGRAVRRMERALAERGA